MTSILSNLHLLLRVPSFSRWPLKLHFFAPDAHQAWVKWCSTANEPLRGTLEVVTDFVPRPDAEIGAVAPDPPNLPSGIHRLPLDYTPMKNYVAKTNTIVAFEMEGDCVVCKEHLPTGEGFYAVCSNEGCEGVGHIACWSKHLLGEEGADHVLPVSGHCPSCHGPVDWGEMMREMSLRMRGQKEVEKLLRKLK
jgi:structure-specific endonuclease subunit SLX1